MAAVMVEEKGNNQRDNLLEVYDGRQQQQRRSNGGKLLVSNLPQTVTFDRVSQMTTACGEVKTVQVHAGKAVVEFVSPAAADKFMKTYNRKMMDLSILTITRL